MGRGAAGIIANSRAAATPDSQPIAQHLLKELCLMSSNAFTYTAEQLAGVVEAALEHARAQGASAEAEASEGFGQSVTVRRSEVETIEYNRDKALGVTVYVGHSRG